MRECVCVFVCGLITSDYFPPCIWLSFRFYDLIHLSVLCISFILCIVPQFFSLGISISARFFHSHFVINLKFTKWKQLRSENIQTKKYIKLHHRKKSNPKRLCSSHSPLRISRWRSFIPSSSIVLLCLDFVFGSRSILFLIFYFFFSTSIYFAVSTLQAFETRKFVSIRFQSQSLLFVFFFSFLHYHSHCSAPNLSFSSLATGKHLPNKKVAQTYAFVSVYNL